MNFRQLPQSYSFYTGCEDPYSILEIWPQRNELNFTYLPSDPKILAGWLTVRPKQGLALVSLGDSAPNIKSIITQKQSFKKMFECSSRNTVIGISKI